MFVIFWPVSVNITLEKSYCIKVDMKANHYFQKNHYYQLNGWSSFFENFQEINNTLKKSFVPFNVWFVPNKILSCHPIKHCSRLIHKWLFGWPSYKAPTWTDLTVWHLLHRSERCSTNIMNCNWWQLILAEYASLYFVFIRSTKSLGLNTRLYKHKNLAL